MHQVNDGSQAIVGVDMYRHAVWPTLLFVYLLALLQLGGLDDRVVNGFYDALAHGFPMRHAFVTETVMHDMARVVMQAIAAALLLLTLVSFVHPALTSWRRMLVFVSVSLTLSVLIVDLGKHFSVMDCPWDLARYGGKLPYFGLFSSKPDALPPGHCFPGGHSSAGFAFFTLYFAARRAGWRHYRWMLLPPVVIGLAFALTQWSRGAHFPSHDLVSAYVCWMVPLLGDTWVFSSHRA